MKAKSQKIGALEKVSFFLANVGNIPLMSLLSSFLHCFIPRSLVLIRQRWALCS